MFVVTACPGTRYRVSISGSCPSLFRHVSTLTRIAVLRYSRAVKLNFVARDDQVFYTSTSGVEERAILSIHLLKLYRAAK